LANSSSSTDIISYQAYPKDIKFYHKDPNGSVFGNFASLRNYLNSKNKKLTFAMNGGMYLKDLSPQGLYIEDSKLIKKTNRKNSTYGNFYMKPNGVFYITKNNRPFNK
jgi:uncharacterized protein YigE (DUF2233 family)